MMDEVIKSLNLRPQSTVVDCTVGTGGHSIEILKHITPKGRLIAIDRDKESLECAKEELKEYGGSTIFVHNDFRNIDRILDDLQIEKVDAILFDLGISSFQLEAADRGFSIKNDGPLDMRMDRSSYISAYDLVNNLTEEEISSILRAFGQERWHNRIARHLVRARVSQPIATTGQLSSIILKAIPHGLSHSKIHPATRSFQAFRIAVNRELESLEEALRKAVNYLSKGGRMSVIAFHSLEDRIVKNTFKKFFREGRVNLVNNKPVIPEAEEILVNPRARSAKLRTIERI